MTVQRIAQMYRERLDIGIPHPLSKTCHMAKFLGIYLPCPMCPFDFSCHMCDSKIEGIYNEVIKVEAN